MLTIDDAIAKLQQARTASHLHGSTVLTLSLADSGLEPLEIEDMVLVADPAGAVLEVRCPEPAGLQPVRAAPPTAPFMFTYNINVIVPYGYPNPTRLDVVSKWGWQAPMLLRVGDSICPAESNPIAGTAIVSEVIWDLAKPGCALVSCRAVASDIGLEDAWLAYGFELRRPMPTADASK